jgi:hypothetical protein
MTRVTIEIVRDAGVQGGGKALLLLHGLAEVPTPATFRIDLIDDEAMLAPARRGWPAGDLTPLSARLGEKGVELLIGPDVVDAPLLLPGTPVAISVPAAGLRQELRWPSLPVSKVERRAAVVVSGEQRAASIAARAEAQRTELARITAARLEAEREEREAALALLESKRVTPAAAVPRVAAGNDARGGGAAMVAAAAAAHAVSGIRNAEPVVATATTPPPLPNTTVKVAEHAETRVDPNGVATATEPPSAANVRAPTNTATADQTADRIDAPRPASTTLALDGAPSPRAAGVAHAEDIAVAESASAVLSRQVASRAAPRASSSTLQWSFGLGFLVASGLAIAATYLFNGEDIDGRRRSEDLARLLRIEADTLREQVSEQAEARRRIEAESSRKLADAEAERKRLLADAAAAVGRADAEAARRAAAEAEAAQRAEAERQQRLAGEEAARRAAAEAEAAQRAEAERQQRLAEAEAARKAAAEAEAVQRAEAERQQRLAGEEAARKAAAEAEVAQRAEAERRQKLAEAEAARKAAAEAEAAQRAEVELQQKLAADAATRRAQESDAAHRREVEHLKSEARDVGAHRSAEIADAAQARRRTDGEALRTADVAAPPNTEAPAETRPAAARVAALATPAAEPVVPVVVAVKPGVSTAPRAGGLADVAIRAPAHAGQRVSIAYASMTLVRTLDKAGNLDLVLDLVEGDGEAVVSFSDGASERIAVRSSDGDKLRKVAILWDSPVDLDLHALEYGGRIGGAGHLWSSAPGSGEAAFARLAATERSHGFLSTVDDGRGAGAKLEVYTIWLAQAQRSGIISFAIDNVTRGDVPSGDHCGEGSLASVPFTVIRYAPDAAPTRESVMLSPAPCGQPLGAEGRLNRAAIEALRIRQ